MKFLLDTDTLIYFLKGNANIVHHISKVTPSNLGTSIINHSELLFGAFNSTHKEQNLKKIQDFFANIEILPYCTECSYIFAENKAFLKKKGNIVADLDLMIASIAIKNQMILITNNKKHFQRIKKLKLDNWYQ